MRILFIIILFSLKSCNSPNLPKQKGFFAPEFFYPNYENFNSNCNYSFVKNVDAEIIYYDDCIYELDYKKLNSKIYINRIKLNQNLNSVYNQFEEKVFNNSEYADQIRTSEYSDDYNNIYSRVYLFIGDTPSNIQFYITDSISNFLSASLYFNSEPNYDSLLPYIHYIRGDIKKIIETIDWKNE